MKPLLQLTGRVKAVPPKQSDEISEKKMSSSWYNTLLCLSAVCGQEAGLRHPVVWLFTDHGGFDPAVGWPNVWTVRTFFLVDIVFSS